MAEGAAPEAASGGGAAGGGRTERRVRVTAPHGLHARVAVALAGAAAAAPAATWVRRPDGPEVAADDLLGLMTLTVDEGEELVVAAEGTGPGAAAAVDALAAVLAGGAG